MVSRAYKDIDAEEVEKNAIPRVNCDCLSYSCCYMIDEDSTRYIVASAFDTKKPQSSPDAIQGAVTKSGR